MKRRTLDLIFSGGAFVLAGMLLLVGLVLRNDASFADDYVRDQLSQQKIAFKAVDELSDNERAFTEARSGCVLKYAGQPLATGRQAECYANEYIGGHLRDPNRIANANGLTYSELGTVQGEVRTQITEAEAANDTVAAAELKTRLENVTTARETVFKGEMLRGALLSTYGFSVLGDKAGQVSYVVFSIAGLLLLLAIVGFVHALMTSKDRLIHVPEHLHAGNGKQLVGV